MPSGAEERMSGRGCGRRNASAVLRRGAVAVVMSKGCRPRSCGESKIDKGKRLSGLGLRDNGASISPQIITNR